MGRFVWHKVGCCLLDRCFKGNLIDALAWQNGIIDSFNSTVRYGFLNMEVFYTLAEVHVKTKIWWL
jgi:hypothetical protein